LQGGGVYTFSTHEGDIIVGVQEHPNVTGTVATFDGEFSSSFPIKLVQTRHRKRQNFVLGSGAARLEIDAFQGRIRLEKGSAALKAALDRLKSGQRAVGEEARHWRKEVKWKRKQSTAPETPETPEAPETPAPPDRSPEEPEGFEHQETP
jgi:hypothetical protein